MDPYTLLCVRSFLPDRGPLGRIEADQTTRLEAKAVGFERSATPQIVEPQLVASPVDVPHLRQRAPVPTRAQAILSEEAYRPDGGSAEDAFAYRTTSARFSADRWSGRDDEGTFSPATLHNAVPLALVAAHPSIRRALQMCQDVRTCPHGHVLRVDAQERFVLLREEISAPESGDAGRAPPHRSHGVRSLLPSAVSAGRLDCVECQRGGVLSRCAVAAYYAQQQLGSLQQGRCERQRHNIQDGSGGCTVGCVHITEESAVRNSRTAAAMEFSVTLHGPQPLSTALRPAKVHKTDLSSSVQHPSPPQGGAEDAAASLCGPPPHHVVQQLQLSMWWLQRCVHRCSGHRRDPHHRVPALTTVDAPSDTTAMHPDRPLLTTMPAAFPLSTAAEPSSKGSAARVMAAVAYARSLRATRAGASTTMQCSPDQASTPIISAVATAAVREEEEERREDGVVVDFHLHAVQLPAHALVECYHVLAALSSQCSVRRLMVHYDAPPVPTPVEKSRAALSPASSAPLTTIHTRGWPAEGAVRPIAFTAPVTRPHSPPRRSPREGDHPHSSAHSGFYEHQLTPLRAEANTAVDLHAPLPMPSQLPGLFQSLEELVIAGLPSRGTATQLRWVEELLRQLRDGVRVEEDTSTCHTPRSSTPEGSLWYVGRAAAPCLRRLILLEGKHRPRAIRSGDSGVEKAMADEAESVGSVFSHGATATAVDEDEREAADADTIFSPVDFSRSTAAASPRLFSPFQRSLGVLATPEARVAHGGHLPHSLESIQLADSLAIHSLASADIRAPAAVWSSSPPHATRATAPVTHADDGPQPESDNTTHAPATPSPALASPLEELYVAPTVACVLNSHATHAAAARSSSSHTRTTRAADGSSAPTPRLRFPSTPFPLRASPWICNFKQLRSLNLSHSTVDDVVCSAVLDALPQLQELHVSWCVELHDVAAVLRRAATRQLRVLNAVGLRALTSSTLEALCMRRCPRLMSGVEELYLAQCPVLAVGCVAFACPRLRRLQLPDTTLLDATAAATLLSTAAGGTRETTYLATKEEGSCSEEELPYWEVRRDRLSATSLASTTSSAHPHASALSVQGYAGLVPLLSRLFPGLTQLEVHDVEPMRMARGDAQHLAYTWNGQLDDDDETDASEVEYSSTDVTASDLAAMRAAYVDYLRHGEFYSLHCRLPHLRALFLDRCAELGQLLSGGSFEHHHSSSIPRSAGDVEPFSFGGAMLSLTGAVHDVESLESLLTWRAGVTGGSLTAAHPRSCGRGEAPHHHHLTTRAVHAPATPSCLRELRLSGCRGLRSEPMVRAVLQRCPHLRVLSVADTLLTDAALAQLCSGLQSTLTALDLSGCAAVTDVSPLLRCPALRHVRLPGGQSLHARTMSVDIEEGLQGLCAVLGQLCPDLRRVQLHGRGTMDAAEVVQVSLLGRWVAEVDLSHMVGLNGSTMLALNAPTAPSNLNGVLTRINVSYTAMNNTMLRTLVHGVVGDHLQELRLHGCHCVSDVRCLATTCRHLRVLKLSGTSVDAAALSLLVSTLPCLADLDVRYCARVRDVHWLADFLLKQAERRRQLALQQQQQQQQHDVQHAREIQHEKAAVRCSQCPVLRAHRPTMALAAVRQSAVVPSLPTRASTGVRSAGAVVIASPLVGGRSTSRRGSDGAVHSLTFYDGSDRGPLRGNAALGTVGVARLPSSVPALSSFPPAPLCSPSHGHATQAGTAQRVRCSVGGVLPPCSLAQVAFGNNHCYLTADMDDTLAATQHDSRNGCTGAGGTSTDTTSPPASTVTSTAAPAKDTVVLQEAVPGLFAVLALWRPQTSVLVLLRPGSMRAEEWREVEQWMPQLRIREMSA